MADLTNEKGLKKAQRKEKEVTAQDLLDMRNVLQTQSGRRVIAKLINESYFFQSIWVPSAEIHFRAGWRDFGAKIWAWAESADQEALFQMRREIKQTTDDDKGEGNE